jgi:probable HAF family extracellular repeat protein
MLRKSKHVGRWLAIAVAVGVVCSVPALAKPPNSTPRPYVLVDLFGFPGAGCQSSGLFITHRDASDNILIGGTSVVFYADGGWDGYPAMWHVDIHGYFPETDPVNFGAADDGTGREAKGLSSFCSGVMATGTFQCFEQYEDGTWIAPSHVAFPDGEHRELPGAGPYNRDTYISGMNDLGQIVGTYGLGGGIWQLNPDRTISGPISLGEFCPAAINDFGVMVGVYMGWPAIAERKEDGTLTIVQLNSSLRFWGADAKALNDRPIDDPALMVVGISRRDADGNLTFIQNGYAWKPFGGANSLVWLPTFGGPEGTVPAGVNTRGEIVGWSETSRRDDHAFLFKNGTMFDLNSMAEVGRKTLVHAYAINNDGDIVGLMGVPVRGGGEAHGFLLRPNP